MEHLFGENEAEALGLEISTVTWRGFDHDTASPVDFKFYPLVRGWTEGDLDNIQKGNLSNLSRQEAEILAMLQSWFTLGFLEAAWQEHFRSEDFIVGANRLFSTHSLRHRFTTKLTQCLEMPSDQLRSFLENLHETQKVAYQWISLFELGTAGDCSGILKLAEPYVRNCVLLAEMLRHFEVVVARARPRIWLEREQPAWSYSKRNTGLLTRKLKEGGWCQSTFLLLRRYSYSAIEIASLMPMNDPNPERHRDCEENACHAHTVDTATYQTKHANDDCDCEFLRLPFDSVKAILEDGGTPVLDLDVLLGSSSGPSVIRMESEQVTVFSHVWSDGLGSSTEKGLPKCQVERLSTMVSNVRSGKESALPKLAWIDSMCIPEDRKLRSAAIRGMASVYRKSFRTIVLDSSLLNSSLRSTLQLATQILTSTWMRRLWTFQEGSLATNLHFMFKDNDHISASIIVDLATENPHCFITWQLAEALAEMSCRGGSQPMDLAAVLRLIPFRKCSRADDETLALAPVMGLEDHMAALLEKRDIERMVHFWRIQGQVPLALPFLQGKKLDTPGFRWALESFVTDSMGHQIYGESLARVTEKGLEGTYLVVKLDKPLDVEAENNDESGRRAENPDKSGKKPKQKFHIQIRSETTGDDSCLAETSLVERRLFDMTLMITSTQNGNSRFNCVGLMLEDRFYPETMAILLGNPSQGHGVEKTEDPCFQHSGMAFMVPRTGEDLPSLSGIASMTKMCLG